MARSVAERRRLLAAAANEFLNGLLGESVAQLQDVPLPEAVPIELGSAAVPGHISGDHEEAELLDVNIWITEHSLPEGEMLYELVDAETGDVKAILDLAWPQGIQTQFSEPVALLLNEAVETLEIASAAGFRCFTDVPTFQAYVEKDILALDAPAAD